MATKNNPRKKKSGNKGQAPSGLAPEAVGAREIHISVSSTADRAFDVSVSMRDPEEKPITTCNFKDDVRLAESALRKALRDLSRTGKPLSPEEETTMALVVERYDVLIRALFMHQELLSPTFVKFLEERFSKYVIVESRSFNPNHGDNCYEEGVADGLGGENE